MIKASIRKDTMNAIWYLVAQEAHAGSMREMREMRIAVMGKLPCDD